MTRQCSTRSTAAVIGDRVAVPLQPQAQAAAYGWAGSPPVPLGPTPPPPHAGTGPRGSREGIATAAGVASRGSSGDTGRDTFI